VATLKLWGLNVRTWLGAYLQACADSGNASPQNLEPFLPWHMDAKRLSFMRGCHRSEAGNSS